jgi:magnesium-transporting ATPase (P-type)
MTSPTLESTDQRWYRLPVPETADLLGGDLHAGLSPEQVARARAQYGPNTLTKDNPPSVWQVG